MSGISIVVVFFLVRAINPRESLQLLKNGVALRSIAPFLLTAMTIPLAYGYRWRLLLDRRIGHRPSLIAAIMCLGGNMFLPARGGDLLRVQYSHLAASMTHSEVLARLFAEKIIDLVSIATVGVLASAYLVNAGVSHQYPVLVSFTLAALALTVSSVVLIKYFGAFTLRCIQPGFRLIGRQAFFDRHVTPLIRDAGHCLTIRVLLLPFLVTMFMWLFAYSLAYVYASAFVGVTLSYAESLLVLFAGALGLMLPAAPSGVGTFHASVVSAFVFLARSPQEGLLAATAIHLLFFVIYVAPAMFFYGRWRLNRIIPT